MFQDRLDAGRRLAAELQGIPLKQPLVLGVPRGGVIIGAVIAEALSAELDVVLARKLRAPFQPELAIGAVAEDGRMELEPTTAGMPEVTDAYLEQELAHQRSEIERRMQLYRAARPQAPVTGRSVILTDDGIATGATVAAALCTIAGRQPHEIVLAVPVAAPERLRPLAARCQRVVCLHTPSVLFAVGEFYRHFEQVDDREVIQLLRRFSNREPAGGSSVGR